MYQYRNRVSYSQVDSNLNLTTASATFTPQEPGTYEIEATYRYNHGTKMNQEKAFEWCKKAAEQGNAKAQYELAQYYRRGFGTEVDILKALEWQKKSEDTAKMRIEALSVKKK